MNRVGAKRGRISLLCLKLSNSGDTLKAYSISVKEISDLILCFVVPGGPITKLALLLPWERKGPFRKEYAMRVARTA